MTKMKMTEGVPQQILNDIMMDKIFISKNYKMTFEELYDLFFNKNKLSISVNEVWCFFNFKHTRAYYFQIITEFCNLNFLKKLPIKTKKHRYQIVNEKTWHHIKSELKSKDGIK